MSQKLAIDGGTPVRTSPWPVWPQHDESEEQALLEVLRSGRWWRFAERPDGSLSETEQFEAAFAQAHGCAHAVAAANGTGTLEMTLKALGIGPGDEVIVPPYTFIATATSVLQIGAVPIFADIDGATFNLDPQRAEEAITARTAAIVPVHFGGQSADMDAFMALADKHGLAVLEDAAHAHGASWRGRPCGSLGHAGSFSFQASKNMTSGEGGAVTTSDAQLAARVRSLLFCGREEGRPWYEHHRLGWNYRITEFQAALLRVQLGRLAEQTARRDANGRYLAARLAAEASAVVPVAFDPRATRISFHLFMMRYRSEALPGVTRERFVAALGAEGVPCSTGYAHGLYRNPMFLNRDFWKGGLPCVEPFGREVDYAADAERCPNCEAAVAEAIWIPQSYLLAETRDMDDIVDAILKIERSLS